MRQPAISCQFVPVTRHADGEEMSRTLGALACAMAIATASAAAQPVGRPVALVLIPGAGGLHPQDFLVASQPIFRAAGLASEMTTSAYQAASWVSDFKARGYRVTLVGMSLGAATAAQALAAGAQPDGVVFAAGGLLPPGTPNGSVIEALGSPARLPQTMVLHHRQDQCHLTPPEAVPAFVSWSRGRARAVWMTGGGGFGPPCRPNTAHTFAGRTEAAAGAIIRFARGR